jgi:uncharacterized protein YjdB
VATVDGGGQVAAVATGTANIRADLEGVSGAAALTVNSETLSAFSVTPASASVPVGAGRRFTARGIYSDLSAHDITAGVSWTSSDEAVATVDEGGLATTLAAGSATITATAGSVTGAATVAAGSAMLSSISLAKAIPSLPAGKDRQLAAIGTYSDGLSHDITSLADWRTSAAGVATVSKGLVKAVAPGTATITVSVGDIEASMPLAVTPN